MGKIRKGKVCFIREAQLLFYGRRATVVLAVCRGNCKRSKVSAMNIPEFYDSRTYVLGRVALGGVMCSLKANNKELVKALGKYTMVLSTFKISEGFA